MARIPRPQTLYELTPQQQQALDLLLSGKTVTETATALDVARETVSRWKHKDAGFVAAYNQGMLSAWEASHKRLLDARAKAIGKLIDLLDEEDPQTALKAAAALVKIDIPKPTGNTSPVSVDRQLALYDF